MQASVNVESIALRCYMQWLRTALNTLLHLFFALIVKSIFSPSGRSSTSKENSRTPSQPVGVPKQTAIEDKSNTNFGVVIHDPARHSGGTNSSTLHGLVVTFFS